MLRLFAGFAFLLLTGCALPKSSGEPAVAANDALRGAYRIAPGHEVSVEYLPEGEQLAYLDYTTGRYAALFADGANRFVVGPAQQKRDPVEITFQFERIGSGRATAVTIQETGAAPRKALRTGFRDLPVSWVNGDVTLSGTLVLPEGSGPHPAIVLTQTSSDAKADGYRKEAMFFASRGFAALVYDKRGVGRSTGDSRHSLQQLAGDASAAVEWLRVHPEIDARRIGVWGQSQGGWIAPLAASLNPHVAFVIAQAAPTVSPADQEIFRVEHQLRNDDYPSEQVAAAVRYQKALMRWVLTGEGRDELSALVKVASAAPWAEYVAIPNADPLPLKARDTTYALYAYDPLPALQALKVPTLFLFGALDAYIPVPQSVVTLRELFATTGFTQHAIHVFPNAAHGFWETPRDSRKAFEVARRWVPGYWQVLGAWLEERKAR